MSDFVTLGLTDDQLEALVRKVGGHDEVLRVLAGDVAVRLDEAAAPPTSVTVLADLGFEERVARGDYGWRHDGLTEALFPVSEQEHGTLEQRLFHFNRNVSSEEAARLIREAGHEPAGIGATLAFGETAPGVQRNHPVVGLGSVAKIEGKLSAPTLWFDGARRTLDLLWLDGDWHRNYRFLGTRRRED